MIQFQPNKNTQADSLNRAKDAAATLLKRSDLGYLQLPFRSEVWSRSEKFAKEIHANHDRLFVIGMGGSALGGKALVEMLGQPVVHFLHNTDSFTVAQMLLKADNSNNPHFLFISKSGNTLEIAALLVLVEEYLQKRTFPIKKHVTVITEEKPNPLFNWAKEKGLKISPHPQDVGGRFSVFTDVGLVPAIFSGISASHLQRGAAWAYDHHDLAIEIAAASLDSFQNNESITVFWSYVDHLAPFLPWLQQLWSESIGKKIDRNNQPAPRVSTPMAALGASDQHSILQQFMEGARDKFIIFIREKSAKHDFVLSKPGLEGFDYLVGKKLSDVYRMQSEATQSALAQAEVSTASIWMKEINEETITALMMTFELVIGILGEALNINAFDQPGVELGKKIAKQKISDL